MLLTMKIEDVKFMTEIECGILRKKSQNNVTLERKNMLRIFNYINRAKNLQAPVTRFEIASNIFEYTATTPISKFRKLKSLKIYTPVGYDSDHLIVALGDLKELDELAYRCIACNFTADYLLKLIENAKNLHHLYISFEQNMSLKLDAQSYRKFLNAVGRRSNDKPLHMIFICNECDFNAINVPSAMDPSLYISKHVI